MPNLRPWTVERIKGKGGYGGISIRDAEGLYVANMIFQLRENEMANARLIVDAVNAYRDEAYHSRNPTKEGSK